GRSTPGITSVRQTPADRANGATTELDMSPDGPSSGMFTQPRPESQALSAVEQLKLELHRRLIARLDLAALERITDESVIVLQIRQAIAELLRGEATPLSQAEREDVVDQIVYEVIGLGPIEPLFRDRAVTDILVNGPKEIYVEKGGRLSRAL